MSAPRVSRPQERGGREWEGRGNIRRHVAIHAERAILPSRCAALAARTAQRAIPTNGWTSQRDVHAATRRNESVNMLRLAWICASRVKLPCPFQSIPPSLIRAGTSQRDVLTSLALICSCRFCIGRVVSTRPFKTNLFHRGEFFKTLLDEGGVLDAGQPRVKTVQRH